MRGRGTLNRHRSALSAPTMVRHRRYSWRQTILSGDAQPSFSYQCRRLLPSGVIWQNLNPSQ
jgi:hypothetical protein